MPELTANDFERIADAEIDKLRQRLSDPANITLTAVVEFMINSDYPNHVVLATVRRHFPGCRTSMRSVSTERSRLRVANPDILTSTQALNKALGV